MKTWKGKEIFLLEKRYPDTNYSVEAIAKTLHRTTSSIRSKAIGLGITRGVKRWKKEYGAFLEENYKALGALECARILGYSDGSTSRRARQLGLNKEIKFWAEEEIEMLKDLSSKHFTQVEIAKELDKTPLQVKNKLEGLQIRSSWWLESEVLFLKANYNSHNAGEIALDLNRNKASIYRKASSLGLTEKDNSGQNHYGFIGDHREYPSEWTSKLKRKIRERDEYKCQVCLKTQKEERQYLQVHHIDYNKENCKETNLITLCRACHARTNINREQWQLFFESLLKEQCKHSDNLSIEINVGIPT